MADGGRAGSDGWAQGDRPSLSPARLVLISAYWLGIASIFAGLLALLGGRLEYQHLVPPGTEGRALLQMTALGSLLALFVQPTIGTISDYTTSRWAAAALPRDRGAPRCRVPTWNRRLEHGPRDSAAFFLALQLSSNSAQGPFQGFVSDLVPNRQVGLASGLVGLMRVAGTVVGYAVGAWGIRTGSYEIATAMLAVVELAAMVATLAGVPDEPPGRDRRGRPWRSIALEAWGMDVLRERSFLWFVGARLLILMASGVLLNLLPFYLARCFAMDRDAAGGAILLLSAVGAFTNAATVVPAARLSDRIGRKRTITISCAIGTTSLLVCALAPAFPVAVAGVVSLRDRDRDVPLGRLGAPVGPRPAHRERALHGDQQRRLRALRDPRRGSRRGCDGPRRRSDPRPRRPACLARPRRPRIRRRRGPPSPRARTLTAHPRSARTRAARPDGRPGPVGDPLTLRPATQASFRRYSPIPAGLALRDPVARAAPGPRPLAPPIPRPSQPVPSDGLGHGLAQAATEGSRASPPDDAADPLGPAEANIALHAGGHRIPHPTSPAPAGALAADGVSGATRAAGPASAIRPPGRRKPGHGDGFVVPPRTRSAVPPLARHAPARNVGALQPS